MSWLGPTACVLLCAPIVSLAQPAPEAPAPSAAAAPLDPFSSRGRVVVDAALRVGPDSLAGAKTTLPAGTPVDYVPAPVRNHHRVRLASGESGYVLAPAIAVDEARTAPLFVAAAPPAAVAASAPRPPLPPPPPSRLGAFVHAGFVDPSHADLEAFSDGLALEAGVVARATEQVALEVSVGWSRVKAKNRSSFGQGPTLVQEMTLRSVPLLAAVRVGTRSAGTEFYALAGGGVDFVALTMGHDTNPSDSAHPFVFQLGLGASAGPRAGPRVDLGFRYLRGHAEGTEYSGGIDMVTLTGGVSF